VNGAPIHFSIHFVYLDVWEKFRTLDSIGVSTNGIDKCVRLERYTLVYSRPVIYKQRWCCWYNCGVTLGNVELS